MTWLDYAVIGVCVASMAVGVWRGLVREVLSILGWVIAFLAANLFAGPLGPEMPDVIPGPHLKLAAAYVIVFVGTLAATSLVAMVVSKVLHAVGLGGIDRLLGAAFGLARAALVVLAAAVLAGLTDAPGQAYWKNSVSGPLMAQAARMLRPLLPQTLAERLRYD